MAQTKVDISSLTPKELLDLANECHKRIPEITAKAKAAKRKEIIASGKLNALVKSIKDLSKEGTTSFQINLPITFTVKSNFDSILNDLGCNYKFDLEDIEQIIVAKLDKTKFTPKQYKILQQAIITFTEDACSDIWEIYPEEFKISMEKLIDKFNDISVTVQENGLKTNDLK